MVRRARGVLCAVVLGGCGGEEAGRPLDASPGPEADADDGCRPLVWEGDHAIRWACVAGCASDPPFRYYDRLAVAGTVARFHRCDAAGFECEALDEVAISGPCIVSDGLEYGLGRTEPYEVCKGACGATGELSFAGYPGPESTSTWQLTVE